MKGVKDQDSKPAEKAQAAAENGDTKMEEAVPESAAKDSADGILDLYPLSNFVIRLP